MANIKFEIEELENGFLIVANDRRLVSPKDTNELTTTILGVLGVDATKKRKKRAPAATA